MAITGDGVAFGIDFVLNDKFSSPISKITRNFDRFSNKIESKIPKIESEINKLTNSFSGLNSQMDRLSKQTINPKFNNSGIKSFEKSLGGLASNFDLKDDTKQTKQPQKVQKFAGFSGAKLGQIQEAGQSLVQFGSTITSFFNESINVASKFSDLYGDVSKTTGLTNEQVKELTANLENLGSRTSTQDLLKISVIGGQMGIARDKLLDFSKTADKIFVSLGDEMGGNIEKIIPALTKITSSFRDTTGGDTVKNLERVGSVLNKVASSGAFTAKNLQNFSTRFGQLQGMNFDVSQAVALGAGLEKVGISADRGSSGLSNIVGVASNKLPKFAQVMGISEQNLTSLLNTNPFEFLLQFSKSLQGMSNVGVAKTLKTLGIGTQESIASIKALGTQINTVRDVQKLANTEFMNATSLNEEFAIKNNTLQASFERMQNRITSIKRSIGETISKAFAPLGGAMDVILSKIQAFVNTPLGKVVLKITAIFGGLALAVGTVLTALGGLGTAIIGIKMGLGALGLAGGIALLPLIKIIAVIGLVIGAGILLYKTFQKFNQFTGIFDKVSTAFQLLREGFSSFNSETGQFKLSMDTVKIGEKLGFTKEQMLRIGAWGTRLKSFIDGVKISFENFGRGVSAIWKKLTNTFEVFQQNFRKKFDEMGIPIFDLIGKLSDFQNFGEQFGNVIIGVLGAITISLGLLAVAGLATFTIIAGAIFLAISPIMIAIKLVSILQDAIEGFKVDGFTGAWNNVKKNIQDTPIIGGLFGGDDIVTSSIADTSKQLDKQEQFKKLNKSPIFERQGISNFGLDMFGQDFQKMNPFLTPQKSGNENVLAPISQNQNSALADGVTQSAVNNYIQNTDNTRNITSAINNQGGRGETKLQANLKIDLNGRTIAEQIYEDVASLNQDDLRLTNE